MTFHAQGGADIVDGKGGSGNPWVTGRRVLVADDGAAPGESAGDSRRADVVEKTSSPSRALATLDTSVAEGRIPSWEIEPVPHLGGVEQRPSGEDVARAGWWWLGVHGGAGVNTLLSFLPGGLDAYRRWPAPRQHPGPGAVILVCRTHAYGLAQAREAVSQWQASDVPEGLLLAGLVAVADAPGKLPRRQSEVLRLLAGAVPRMWTVPWLDELRMVEDPQTLPLPPSLVRLSLDLEALRHRFGNLW